MSTMNRRLLIFAQLFVFATCTPANTAELPEKGAQMHLGVATCAASQCHGSAIPRNATGVFQNEYVTWTQSDTHSKAYEVLSNKQSQMITGSQLLPCRIVIDNGIITDLDEHM